MSTIKHIVCRHCGKTNRVPSQKLRDIPRCGNCKQSLFAGSPVELDGDHFTSFLTKSDIPVVVDFWAPWCGPCKMMAPAFSDAAGELEPDFILAKLNTQDWPQSAAPFKIAGIPTMIFFRNGKEIARTSGAMSLPQIVRWVRSVQG